MLKLGGGLGGLARRRRAHISPQELDITAFMNLMIVLVPFLLISAIFSQMAMVELNIPPAASGPAATEERPPFQLFLTVRTTSVTLSEKTLGVIESYEWTGEETFDWSALEETLVKLKEQAPNTRSITLLAEADIDYQKLITFIDRVTFTTQVTDGKETSIPLFPGVSLGDAVPIVAPQADRS